MIKNKVTRRIILLVIFVPLFIFAVCEDVFWPIIKQLFRAVIRIPYSVVQKWKEYCYKIKTECW